MKIFIAFLDSQRGIGYLITRVLFGWIILWAGVGKLTGPGFSGIGGGFTRMGIPLPDISGPFIILLELLGGLGLVLGLFTRYLGVLFVIEFLVVLLYVKLGADYGRVRIDVALLAFAVLFATNGAGRFSLDKKLGLGS
ncbi:MAG: DoxX family protein [bacterium]